MSRGERCWIGALPDGLPLCEMVLPNNSADNRVGVRRAHVAGQRLTTTLGRIEVIAPRYLRGSESPRYDHRRAAAWAVPARKVIFAGACGRWHGRTHSQQLPAQRELLGARAVGQESEMPNPDKAFRQHMQEESAEELRPGERHLALLAAMSVVLPSECGALAIKCQ